MAKANKKPKKSAKLATKAEKTVKVAEKGVAKKLHKVKAITTRDAEKLEAKFGAKHGACPCEHRDPQHPLKGFFAKKGDPNETILTIFKSHKIWGALIAEAIGTMLVAMLLLVIGFSNAVLYAFFVGVAISAMTVTLSGAHLNPIVTVGMMASRRVSAIRGVLYILAQVIGAWLGFLVSNAFILAGGSEDYTLFQAEAISTDTFWAVFFIELMGALILGFMFARAWRFRKRQPLTFAIIAAAGIALPFFLATFFTGYLELSATGSSTSFFIFNPAIALMYQILPSSAEGFGELMGLLGMSLCVYVVVPMVGGVAGNYLAEVTSRLADEEPACCDRPHGPLAKLEKKAHK